MSIPNCPNCDATISPDAYNSSTLMVQCHQCQFVGEVSPLEVVRSAVDKDVEQPKGITISIEGEKTVLEVSHRQFKAYLVPLIIAVVLMIFVTQDFVGIKDSISVWVGASCFILFLLWLGLDPLLKKTRFEMDGDRLSVTDQRFLFFRKDRSINKQDLVQTYVKARKHDNGENTTTTFTLNARLSNGKDTPLLANFKSPKPLYFVETQIEEVFGLMKNAYQNYKADQSRN